MPFTSPASRMRASGMPRDVWVLACCAFTVAVGFGVMVPVLPVFVRSFEVTTFQIGLVISAFAAVRLVTSPFLPRLNRLIGERMVFGTGMFLVAASSAVMAYSRSYEQLLLLRSVGGIGSAMFTVSAMVILLRAAPANLRGRAGALYMGGFTLGGMTGPALGGLLSAISIRAPFLFYAAMLALAGVLGLAMLSRSSSSEGPESRQPVVSLRQAWRDSRYRAACVANFAQGWQSFGVRNALIPLIVVESLRRPPSWTGGAFAVSAVVQAAALSTIGRAVDVKGRRPVMILAGMICAAATVAIAYAPAFWLLAVALAVYGLGASMFATAPTAAVGDVVQGRGGQPVAVFTMLSDLGAVCGPLAAGLLADYWGTDNAVAIGALLMVASALMATRMSAAFGEPIKEQAA